MFNVKETESRKQNRKFTMFESRNLHLVVNVTQVHPL